MDRKLSSIRCARIAHLVQHFESCLSRLGEVATSGFWYSGRGHVTIADRLNLFEAMTRANPIDSSEQIIEHANYLR